MDSPRGRIYLMKAGNEGKGEMNGTFVEHIDRCLGCMACLTACPSGVQYDKLIEATRSQVERNYPRSLPDRAFRRLLFELFPSPGRLRMLAAPLWLYQASGLRTLVQRLGLLRACRDGCRRWKRCCRQSPRRACGRVSPPCCRRAASAVDGSAWCWAVCSAYFSATSTPQRRACWPPRAARSSCRPSRAAAARCGARGTRG